MFKNTYKHANTHIYICYIFKLVACNNKCLLLHLWHRYPKCIHYWFVVFCTYKHGSSSQWTIRKYKQGSMSLHSPHTRPCHDIRGGDETIEPIYDANKMNIQNNAPNKHIQSTRPHTHRPSLVYLAAHPSREALWSHIKQITTWETTHMHEFTHICRGTLSRTAECEDLCGVQVVPENEWEEG